MDLSIEDVTFVEELTTNLLSVRCIRKKDLEVTLKSDHNNPEKGLVVVTHIEYGVVFMAGLEANNGLYEIILSPDTGSKLM